MLSQKREKAKRENWNRQGFYVNMPLDFLGLARTRLFQGLVPQTQNRKLVRNSLGTEPLLYCIKCNTVEVQKPNKTPQKTWLVCGLRLIVFVHSESRLRVLLTWQASMQIYWNNNSNNDNNNKEQNKTKQKRV